MRYFADPIALIIYFKVSVFVGLMFLSFLEAKLFIDDGNLKNQKTFYLIAFISNIIVGSFLLLPTTNFDLLILAVYIVRTIIVGFLFIRFNKKQNQRVARNSYIWTIMRVVIAFVLYNFVFLLVSFVIGFI